MDVKGTLDTLLPILESKAVALILTLAFATYIAYVCHRQTSLQRETTLVLHEKLLESYTAQVTLAKDCVAKEARP